MFEVLAVIAVIGYVRYTQLAGQFARGRRVVVLPLVLTIIGITDLNSHGHQLRPVDVVCLAIGIACSVAVGLGLGAITHLESRDGVLWSRLPARGLWLWAALVASRGVMYAVASGLDAHVAVSGASLLLMLGLNRLAQAGVMVARAHTMGVPFAPEKDGRTFLSGVLSQPSARD